VKKVLRRIQENTTVVTTEYVDSRYEKLLFRGHPGVDFFIFAIVSSLVTALGFMMNSPSVIIGAMVISPLLYPIVLAGSAASKSHWRDMARLFQALLIGGAVALASAAVLTWLIPFEYNSEIQSRLASSPLQYFLVAILSGLAGTFAYYWPDISESITGVGIAVALMPPIVMTGISIGNTDMELFLKSGLIVIINIAGIVIAAELASKYLWWYAKKQS
jgi:uncharacterized hydrophobic protein (TIGR00271 family)